MVLLRFFTFLLIATAAGLGGALSYRMIAYREAIVFERQYDDAVDMMFQQLGRSLADRVTALETADALVKVPPRGKASLPWRAFCCVRGVAPCLPHAAAVVFLAMRPRCVGA